jgi:NAD(P)-dependent dehydrogenase (short-subunit alcohol dehydrogenase family)
MHDMSHELFDLNTDVAVVMGGTGVLGGAIAQGLAQAGAAVAILGRNKERGDACVEKIRGSGGRAYFISCDAQDAVSVRDAHDTVSDYYGGPTILVNAVGGNDGKVTIAGNRKFEHIELNDWKANYDLNVLGGVVIPCQEFGRGMINRGKGSIINIASVSGHVPLSRVVAYSAAKSAVLSLTQFLAREWGQHGVRVNTITPGFFPAEQNKKLLFDSEGKPSPRAAQILGHTPLGRFGSAEELVGAAVFLAAKASSFVTGSDIRVDGGFLAQTV